MIYKEYDEITTDELIELYESVGWTTYSRDRAVMERLLPGASYHVGVRDNGRLIGLIRVISDEVSIVYIQDILVHPEAQRKGIGQKLVQLVFEHYPSIRQTVLITDSEPKSIRFYQSLGMTRLDEQAPVCCFVKFR